MMKMRALQVRVGNEIASKILKESLFCRHTSCSNDQITLKSSEVVMLRCVFAMRSENASIDLHTNTSKVRS